MGDDAKLRALIARVERAASGNLAKRVRQALAEQTREEIARTFRERRSPDGASWKPTANGGTPLVASGALRGGFDVTVTPAGVRVTNAADYANVHQHGGRIRRRKRGSAPRRRRRFGGRGGNGVIPARPMVPTSRWGAAPTLRLRAAASRVVRVFLKR
jgi:phage gpG-like protein